MGCMCGSDQQQDGSLGGSKKSARTGTVVPCALRGIPNLGGERPRRLLIAIHCLGDNEMDARPDETPEDRCERIANVLAAVEARRKGVADLALFVAPETYYSHFG